MKYKWILFLLALAILFVVLKMRSPENKSGKIAPDIEAPLADGTPFKLSDLRGQYVLIDFWGSWCPPCRRDNPNLVELYQLFNGKKFKDASGFEIVSIALEKNDRYWQKAVDKDGLKWPYHLLRVSKLVVSDPLAIKYQVNDLPSKFLVDPKGEIVGVNMTRGQIEEYLRARLK